MNKKLLCKIFIAFLALSFTVPPSVLHAGNELTIEQMLQQKTVTINIKNASVKTILYAIQKQSGVSFVFKNEADSKALGNLSLNVKNVTVKEALNTLFADTEFTYNIIGETVTITRKPVVKQSAGTRVLVVGKVIDTSKKPIVGATVLVQNTPTGAITDTNGAFNFLANSNDVLEISFIGKKTIIYNKLSQNSQNVIITLEDDAMAVEDVVVTGYANINKKMQTGISTTLDADKIRIVGTNNIAEMLQGQVAGMIVTNTSSRVGATPKIQIRGQSTLSNELGNQNPIWVVDGIIQDDPININSKSGLVDDLKETIGNQVSWLNPNDIETVTILKDASATAVYGSRASNGVIVITTKKPKGERISINYSGSLTVKSKPRYEQFNYMNSVERILLTEDVFNAGLKYNELPVKQMDTFDGILKSYLDGEISGDTYLKRRAELETVNTNWFDVLTRTAVSHNHNVTLSGSVSDKVSFNASMGYNKDNGQELGNGGEQFTARTSITTQVHPKFRINFSLNGTMSKNLGTPSGINGIKTPLSYATETSRAIPAYNEDGTNLFYRLKSTYKHNTESTLGFNMLNEIEQATATSKNSRFGISINAKWDITKWISYEFTGGYTYAGVAREILLTEESYTIADEYRGYDYGSVNPGAAEYKAAQMPHGGTLDENKGDSYSYNIQNKLIFNKTINDKHQINAMLANEVRSSMQKDFSTRVYGILPNRGNQVITPSRDITPITGNYNPGDDSFGIYDYLSDLTKISHIKNNFVSLFATLAYSYDERYVFNASVRNDMSNRFGQDVNNRFDPTYSFGLKWRVASEKFMTDVKWVTNLNFSVNYGIQGNALLSEGADILLLKGKIISGYAQFGSSISRIPNPYLTWERTSNWDFSVDCRLFNAVNFSGSYYIRESNAVVEQPIGIENGIKTMKLNGGIIHNSGVEGTISFNPVATKNFGLNVSINTSKNWNTGGKSTMSATDLSQVKNYLAPNNSRIIKEGYPLGAFWRYSFKQLDDEIGVPLFNNMEANPEDVLMDPTSILTYMGKMDPDITAGISLSVRYKRLTLSTSFAAIFGGKKTLPNPYDVFGGNYNKILTPYQNASKDLLNRWKKPGDELRTIYPAVTADTHYTAVPGLSSKQSSMSMWHNSDVMVVNGGFFRCNNLSLSYSFNRSLLDKLKISQLTLSGSVSNLFVIGSKRFNGFDPELGSSVRPRNFSISLNVGF